MKITQEQIKQLTELHPNNAVLGAAVRELVNSASVINEVTINPNQMTIDDMINAVQKNRSKWT